jgi:protein arginine N-methyltransferase 1
MHPLTRFFDYLKRIHFPLVLAREHLTDRDLTEWYPDWYYELMEADESRNRLYAEVIRDSVAGKVVLEVGTGNKALWAVCCARAGAKMVYAVEANERACQSSSRFLRSENIDNVRLIRGFSDNVCLPERCDVLVQSLVGDIGSCEGVVACVEDAKQRLLTPGAVHIPHRCTTFIVLAEDPSFCWAERVFSFVLRGFRGLDSQSFLRIYGFPVSAALSEPHVFEDITFHREPRLHTDERFMMRIERDGEVRGVCLFIRLYVSETRIVDTWDSPTTWSTPFIRFKTATSVRKGDLVEVHVRSDLSGNPSYSITVTHQADGSPKEIGQYAWSGD